MSTYDSRGAPSRVYPATIRHTKIVLAAIFTTALNDALVQVHPCRGVKTSMVPRKEFRIVTPAQFNEIYASLTDPQSQLLVETAIQSGLRGGGSPSCGPVTSTPRRGS